MTKMDDWISSFPENCEKLKEREKRGCKEAKKFLDDMKRVGIEKFDLSVWAEKAHMQVAVLAAKDFAAGIKEWGEAFKRGDSAAAEAAFSRMLSANPEELSAFSDIVEKNTGKPSVVRDIIPLIASNKSDQPEENEMKKSVNSYVDAELKESESKTDIAALKKDAAIVADAFGRARRLAEAMDSGDEKEIFLAAKEFENADDGDAISRLNKFADKEEFTDEELAVLRELCKTADLDHLNLNPLFEEDENDKREKRVTKEKKKGKSDVQIYTYAEWKDSWHKEREED